MNKRIVLIPLLIFWFLFTISCRYIVVPEGLESSKSAGAENKGWSGYVTNVSKTEDGNLHVDITIRNDTGEWSSMRAADGKPAILTSNGKSMNCDTVFVGTGGHRLAPGFQMRGYATGTKVDPQTQMIYVECSGGELSDNSSLEIDYINFNGELDYYHQEDKKISGKMVLDLNDVATDLSYPVAETIEGLVEPSDTKITAISDNVVSLLDIKRTDNGFEFTWQNDNPTNFPLKTHIGIPPVIGDDGIIYGIFEIMDLASVPLTPAQGSVEWTTQVAVPSDVNGLYILLSVESKNMRNYVSHAVDITDK